MLVLKGTARHKTNICRKKFSGNELLREYMRGLYSHSAEYRKIFLRNDFPHFLHILGGIHCGANTCRACICTRADTKINSWRIICVLVSCQGVFSEGL